MSLRMFKISLLFIISTLFFTSCENEKDLRNFRAEGGIIDLCRLDFSEDNTIKLDGEWEFYWNELPTPSDFRDGTLFKKRKHITVPGIWRRSGLNSEGHATYRLLINFPKKASEEKRHLAMSIPTIYSAYTLWINGRIFAEFGTIGSSDERHRFGVGRKIAFFDIESDSAEIIINVSNYGFGWSGVTSSFTLGSASSILKMREMELTFNLITVVMLIFTSLYHLVFFFFRRDSREYLYFAFVALFFALTIVVWRESGFFNTGSYFFCEWVFVPATTAAALCAFLYIYHLFPSIVSIRYIYPIVVIEATFISLRIFSPKQLHVDQLFLQFLMVSYLIFYAFYISVKAIKENRESSIFFLVSVVPLATFTLHDILLSIRIISGGLFIAPMGLIPLMIMQSVFMAKRFANSFRKSEKLLKDLSQKNDEIEKANERLENLNHIKNKFLEGTYHEIKTPLNGLISLTESAIKTVYSDNKSYSPLYYLKSILNLEKRLSYLIKYMVQISAIKQKTVALNMESIDLRRVIDTTLALTRPFIKLKAIDIEVQISDRVSSVLTDENCILQILYNLISNSINFMDEGSITVSANRKESSVQIKISDTAIGILENRIKQIIDRFEQDTTVETLLDSRKISESGETTQTINLHGYEITCRSKPWSGTLFTFTLPACDEKPEDESDKCDLQHLLNFRDEIENDSEQDNLPSNSTILLADSEKRSHNLIYNFLFGSRCIIKQFSEGQSLLAHIENEEKPDLVILDSILSDMDGYDLCLKIRNIYNHFEMPVLILTAGSRAEEMDKVFNAGANDYIKKPFSKTELLSRISFHIKNLEEVQSFHKAFRNKIETDSWIVQPLRKQEENS